MLDDRTVLDHRKMLEDRLRMSTYRRAIEATCSDRVVAEIGTGLGPLALFALRAGARRVYAIELDPRTLALAAEVAHAHGFGPDRFVPLCGRSDRIELPERVDVLISELLDSAALGENALYYVEDARRRWLRPGGSVIPRALEVDVALSDSAEFARERRFWTEELLREHGIDYAPIAAQLAAPRRSLEVDPCEILTGWARWQTIDFERGDRARMHQDLRVRAERDGRAEGLVLAFRAHLGADTVLQTHPGGPRTHWSQGWLPLPSAIPIGAGMSYRVELELPPTTEPWAPIQALVDLDEEGVEVTPGTGRVNS